MNDERKVGRHLFYSPFYIASCFLTILSGVLNEIFIVISSKLKHCISNILTFAVIDPSDLPIYQIIFIFVYRLELFCDFLQFDWLHERAAFYDILARGSKK